jgi:hypothetical protein
MNPIALNASGFATAKDLAARSLEEARRRQNEWLKARDSFIKDPKLLVYYSFEPEQPWSRALLDQANRRKEPRDGVIVGCSWVTGRWPGKQGLEFKQVSDRVRVHVPGQFDELTFAVWVRVDALPHRYNSLFMTDSWDPMKPHWHISDAGKLQLGVQSDDRQSGAHYCTGTVFSAERLGKWTHLAVVYNRAGDSVAHFVDGKQIKSEPLKLDTPLRIGDAEIGNWNVANRKHNNPVRYFTGCMDEFMIFRKALSKQDINRLYTRGRPPS